MLRGWVALVAFLVACTGPGVEPPSERELEIGFQDVDGSFRPLADGDTLAAVWQPNGNLMVYPSFRSREIDPDSPDSHLTVSVEGVLLAAKDPPGDRPDMQDDGTGNVLWNLGARFQCEPCCVVCRAGHVEARLQDARGRIFTGSVDVRLERGGCPDPDLCCENAEVCPIPSPEQICR